MVRVGYALEGLKGEVFMFANRYHDRKVYHMFAMVNQRGGVSPLCAEKPRKLNLKRELWTFRWEAVTCKNCLTAKPVEAQKGT